MADQRMQRLRDCATCLRTAGERQDKLASLYVHAIRDRNARRCGLISELLTINSRYMDAIRDLIAQGGPHDRSDSS